jgi:hypothetical protein
MKTVSKNEDVRNKTENDIWGDSKSFCHIKQRERNRLSKMTMEETNMSTKDKVSLDVEHMKYKI